MLEMELIDAPGAGAALVPIPILGRAVLFVGLDGRMRARLPDGSILDALQGVPGAAGAQGVKGDTGAAGAPGLAGAAGAQGLPGVAGAQGVKGDAGAAGAQGLPGAAGAQGVKGDTGAAGAQGLVGAAGAQGVPGENAAIVSRLTANIGVSQPGSAGGLVLHSFASPVALVGRRVVGRVTLNSTGGAAVNCTPVLNIGGLILRFAVISLNGARTVQLEFDAYVLAANVSWGGIRQASTVAGAYAALSFALRANLSGAVATQNISLLLEGALTGVAVLDASIEVI